MPHPSQCHPLPIIVLASTSNMHIYVHTLHIFNYEFQLVQLLNFVVIERLTFKFHPYQREIQWNLNFRVKNNKHEANAISFKFYIVSVQKNILHSL